MSPKRAGLSVPQMEIGSGTSWTRAAPTKGRAIADIDTGCGYHVAPFLGAFWPILGTVGTTRHGATTALLADQERPSWARYLFAPKKRRDTERIAVAAQKAQSIKFGAVQGNS